MTDSNSFHYDKQTNDAFLNFNKVLLFPEELQEKYSNMLSIFDKNGDNCLDKDELKSLWDKVKSFAGSDNTLSVTEADNCVVDSAEWWNYIKAIFTKKETTSKELFEFLNLLTYNVMPKENPKSEEKVDMRANITSELKYRNTPYTEEDVEKWNNLITTEAKKYNFPPEIIVAIISRECHFMDPDNKYGCMQVFDINNIKTDKWHVWDSINKQLRADMLESLKTHNLSDKATGIKAGIIAFQGAYARAVAEDKGWYQGTGKNKQPDIPKALEAIRKGEITIPPEKAKKIMGRALIIYNACDGIKEDYSRDCLSRLDSMGYDYTRPIISL